MSGARREKNKRHERGLKGEGHRMKRAEKTKEKTTNITTYFEKEVAFKAFNIKFKITHTLLTCLMYL